MSRREQILQAIADHWAEHLSGPTLREIAEATGTRGASTVLREVEALYEVGEVLYREQDGRMLPRTLRLAKPEPETSKL